MHLELHYKSEVEWMKKRFVFLIFFVFSIIPLAMAYSHFCVLKEALQSPKLSDDVESENSWRDDFTSYDPRWDWGYNAGTGYKTLGTVGGRSVCEGGITDASTSDEYSDCSLHHFLTVGNDEPISAEMRMRYTDRNGLAVGDQGKGTRGCGWWDGSEWGDNVAWFVAFSPGNDESLVGYKCQVRVGGAWILNEDISGIVDMTEWHVYRIDLLSDGTRFYVDDELVASTPYRPQQIDKIEAWVDNAYVYYDNGNLARGLFDLDIDQKMYIDWVKLSSPSPQDTTPPTTTHNYDGLWHNTDITINLTATDDLSGVSDTYYSINDGATVSVSSNGHPQITTEGADNELSYYSVDNDGNSESTHVLSGIKLDKTAPTGSITINNGDASTSSTSVTLQLTYDDVTSGVYQIRYSNDGAWDTEPWESPASTKAWTLTSGAGAKQVYCQIKDNAGLSSTVSDTITLVALISPEASFTYSPPDPEINEVVTFDASSSSDPDGTVVSYFWDFGDGNTETGSYATATHSYAVEGTYNVALTVTDNDGLTNTTSHTITHVIPEFSTSTILLLFVISTLAVAIYRKKK
jgi:PKD repeat protein